MKVLIVGGHLTPALAVINALPKEASVLYCGRKHALEGDTSYSLEYQTISKLKIPFEDIKTGRLQRRFTRHTISSIAKIPFGLLDSIKVIKKFKPDVVLGFGGYVSVPVCIAARILHIPIVIHEQTLRAGLANKMLAFFSKRICVSWESSLDFFPKGKTILTGNPAVSEIFKKIDTKKNKSLLPSLLIIGGSLGSHAINMLVKKCLENLLENFNVVHQTGDAKEFNDFEILSQKKITFPEEIKERYNLVKFIDPSKIISIISTSDLVVTRSGINTITSLLILDKPALTIPLSLSENGEQKENALFFKEHGLGEIAYQKDLDGEKFFALVNVMMKNRKRYKNSKDKGELFLHKEAAKKIIDIIYDVKKTSFKEESQANV